jgi:hypothetical protein
MIHYNSNSNSNFNYNSMAFYATLDSSVLKAAAYSTDETLELEFCSGAIYRYFNAPCTVFENLLAATSKGTYFNLYIRDSFRHHRVA